MNIWLFKPKLLPIITPYEAKRILETKPDTINVSLGKFSNIPVKYETEHIVFKFGNQQYLVHISELEKISNKPERKIFVVTEDGRLEHLGWFDSGNYYQLISVGPNEAPTLEINGIHMHRIKGVSPFNDAKMKVKTLNIKPKMKVLDVCTGLGYTAIWEKRLGADVITIEKDENVLTMAEYNPWSVELKDVKIIHNDASVAIENFEDESFHRILSDPPRFSFAGELYSFEFFKELFRLLKPNGILYHYTGKPGEKSGKSFRKGVLERLRSAGFKVRWSEKTQGFIAYKPRKFGRR